MTPALARPNPLRTGRAIILVLGWFAGTMILSGLAYFLGRATGFVRDGSMATAAEFSKLPALGLANALGATALMVYYGWRDSGLGWRALVPCRAPAQAYVAALSLVLGCALLLSEFSNLLVAFVPMPAWMLRSTVEPGDMGPIQLLVLGVIVAPLSEELLMRGIILRRLRTGMTSGRALVTSSLLFGMAHFFPVQVIQTFVIGLVLGWLFFRTNSLLIPIAGHALNNAIFSAFEISGVKIPGLSAPPQSGVLQLQPWWLDVLGIACVATAWWMFRRMPPVESPSAIPPLLPVPTDSDPVAKSEVPPA
jgi:membrane protease YdiL (CAAX protease family)